MEVFVLRYREIMMKLLKVSITSFVVLVLTLLPGCSATTLTDSSTDSTMNNSTGLSAIEMSEKEAKRL